MEAKHTPTPWRVGPGPSVKAGSRYNVAPTITAGGSAKGMIDEREIAAANADFIVRACNSFDQLLAALDVARTAIDTSEDQEPQMIAALSQIEAALAAAGAA